MARDRLKDGLDAIMMFIIALIIVNLIHSPLELLCVQECEQQQSMSPFFVVTTFHLWLQESTELSLDGPSDAISFIIPALYDVFTVWQNVSIDPDSLINDRPCYFFRNSVFLGLRPLHDAPESFTASVCMFTECTRTHG